MAISKKSYIDLSGLTKFRDLLLKTTIDVDNDTSVDNKTASVSAILEYVSSVESGIINGVNASLNSKVQSVGYASKKFTYTTGNGTTDIVSISTLKTDIGAMTGATSSSAGAMGLVPAPASGKQTSFLRGDGTWVVPTDTNTTYTVASGDNNGQIKVTPSSGSAYNVSVKGLGSAAYTASSAYATSSHNHDASYYLKAEIDTKLDGKSNTGHTHTISNITDLGVFGKSGSTASVGLVPKPSTTAGTTKYLREDGTWVVPTDTNTTYTFASGSTNGTISVKPSTSTTATDIAVKGLGSAAYTASSAYAPASHNHDASYYTKTEVDTKVNGKSDTGHTHTISNITDLGKATSDTLGLVKSSTTGTTENRYYNVAVNSDGTMKVNVPWTDKNVSSTVANTTKAYLVGSSNSSSNTGTLIKDTNVYLDSTAGQLVATTFKGALDGNASTATNATYATKIGTNASHPAIGSATQPVYVNSNGVITAGTALGTMAYKATGDYLASTTRGAKNGVASLDASGLIPSSQLPSYVDDVLEYSAKSSFPSTGETGKIYVDTATNLTYRWSGSAYVEISKSLALGETSSTAYAGDKGATLATNLSKHTSNTSNPHSVTKTQVGLGNVDNTSDANKPISTATQTALNGKSDITHTHNYAGSSSVGGSATSAVALTSKNIGSSSQPVYFDANGKPVAIGYSVATSLNSSNNSNIPTSKAVADYITSMDCRTYENNFINKNMFSYASTVDNSSSAGSYSDGTITMGDGTINVPNGGIVANSGIKGAKVYNAVWNDLVDCIPVDDEVELEYGYCYSFDGERYHKSSEYMEQGVIGIHSDTAGMVMGSKPDTKELHCGVAGFCLAYIDKEYPVGTPLTCTEGGILTEIKHKDKVEYPERVIATYWKSESSETWGSDIEKVKVNGRRWVKIR